MSAMDMFWQAPPISRTLAAAAFTLSILVYTGMLPMYYFVFYHPFLFQIPPQVWRIFTSFLITGKDLGIIFDTYFLYIYGSKLERSSPRLSQAGDFFTYILFVMAVILCTFTAIAVPGDEEDYPCTSAGPSFAINPKGPVCGVGMGLNALVAGGMIFTSALVLAFAYTSTQDDRGQQATFFVITIPAQWIPYAMLLMALVMGGPHAAMVQGTGLVAAHLHDFLTRIWPRFGGGKNLLPTPILFKRWFSVRQRNTGYGTARRAPGSSAAATSPAEGSSSGVLPESWQNRGSGHRLGGD